MWKMGNGASLNTPTANGEVTDNSKSSDSSSTLKTHLLQLRREVKEKDELVQRKDAELHHRMKIIEEKDAEIAKLRKEIHELKCVVQQTNVESKTSVLSAIREDTSKTGGSTAKGRLFSRKEKRQAVSGESSSDAQEKSKKELERFPKDFR